MEKKNFRFNMHWVVLLIFLITVGVIIYKAATFFTHITEEEIDSIESVDTDTEPLDNIMPLLNKPENAPADDGVTTVVCFGNAPLADERDASSGVCNTIGSLSGATVYNCSIPNSYMTSAHHTFDADYIPIDAFSFYWLTTTYTLDNFKITDDAVKAIEASGKEVPEETLEALRLLKSIDFNTVDVITLMYDSDDYFAGRLMYDDENKTNVRTFTGAMTAGIELIQQYYPHIRIIVMSPTYAYALDENGEYESSDKITYGQSYLSTYVIKQAEASYEAGVTFVDHLYGTIHEDIADKYLSDNRHLNEAGRKLVAERFVYALNFFN